MGGTERGTDAGVGVSPAMMTSAVRQEKEEMSSFIRCRD